MRQDKMAGDAERIAPDEAPSRGDSPRADRSPEERLMDLLRAVNHAARHRHAGKGGQQRILATLMRRGDMTQRELMEILGVSSASMSEILGKMEDKGLVERRRNEEDRRTTDVVLTESGRAAALETEEARRAALPDLFAALDEAEKQALAELLEKLVAAWQAEHGGHKGHGHGRGPKCGGKHKKPHGEPGEAAPREDA